MRNSKFKMQDTKGKEYGTLCSIFFALCFLLLFTSIDVSPAEESQSDSDIVESESPEPSVAQPPASDTQPKEVKQDRTMSITTRGGKVVWLFEENLGMAHGSAIVKYEDVTLKADHMWADMDAEVIEAEGNVILEMKDQTLSANRMLFDLKNKKGVLKDGLSLDAPWYYYGEKMSRLNQKDSFIEKGAMTSCSLSNPHYSFEASQIVVHLKKELIAKNVVFKIGGVPLLYLPVYKRSLEPHKRSRFIFKLGSNTFEGYYVKNILPVRWRMLNGSVFLNYTSRRGMNSGTELDYDADKVRFREIFLPVSKDAPSKEWQTAKENIEEILQRAEGNLDKIWLKQIFITFQIGDAEKAKARERVEKVLKECKKENADFIQLARRWSDDKETKSNGGDLGFFLLDENGKWQRVKSKGQGVRGREQETRIEQESPLSEAPLPRWYLPLIEAASKLKPGEISDLVETDEGFHIVKLETKEKEEIRVRHILTIFEPSESAQKNAQNRADDVSTKLSEGSNFEELAKLYSDDSETRDKGGDLGWQVFRDLDFAFRTAIKTLDKGEISRPVTTTRGIYIFKLEEREKTPDFADLAKQYSKAPTAELGGDTGYKSKWELPREVRREAYRLDIYNVSKPIRCEDGYRIVRMEKKRRLGGDIYIRYGDLYSYQIEKNPIKMGQTWDFNIHHNQILWRGSEWEEYDVRFEQERLRREKLLELRAELRLTGEDYKRVYESYTPERELRSYCALDYYWMTRTRSSGHARLIVDGTRDLLGLDTTTLQKYPEISFRPPDYRLYEVQPFKRINSSLHRISSRIQGTSDFAALARKVSEDDRTKEKGGALGWISKGSGINAKVESVIFDPNELGEYELDEGDISLPIPTTEGYYIVKIEKVEEKAGKRERIKARQIFIAISPEIRTKDEASRLADETYRKLVEGKRPSLGFPTLDNTSFSFSTEIGNYYKDIYSTEKNIWLQTANAGVILGKRAIIRMGVARELNLDLDSDYHLVWHSKTRPVGESDIEEGLKGWQVGDRDRNVFSSTWNFNASLSTDLHRIYYPTYIPRVYAMKHTFSPFMRFYYTPPGESEKKEDKRPSLYPFGSGTWTYEQKRLIFGMTNSIDIKTKYKRDRIPIFRWELRTGIDYTEEPGKQYEELRNTFAIEPHKQLSFTNVIEHDLNNIGTDEPILSRFSTDLRYYDAEGRWSGYLSRRYSYYPYNKIGRQFFSGSLDLSWSKTWSLRFDLEYEYDKEIKDISNLRLSFRRILHCWETRIVFDRTGTKYIRKDFSFSINILADPGKALGIGYDDISHSWALRSLPGMGRLSRYMGTRYIEY